MKIILPRFAKPKPAPGKSRMVFRMFKRLDDGRFMLAGWVRKYRKSPNTSGDR